MTSEFRGQWMHVAVIHEKRAQYDLGVMFTNGKTRKGSNQSAWPIRLSTTIRKLRRRLGEYRRPWNDGHGVWTANNTVRTKV